MPETAPNSLDDSEAIGEQAGMLGIARLKHHRVVTQRRGMPSVLEFMVQWRDPALPDSWAKEQWLDSDSGAELIDQYWNLQHHLLGDAIAGRGTTLVDRQLVRMQRRLGSFAGVQAGRGVYKLPRHLLPVPQRPSDAVLCSPAVVGAQMLLVFRIGADTTDDHTRWYHGQVTRAAATKGDKRACKAARAGSARVQFDDKAWEVPVLHKPYTVDPTAGQGGWFLFGDKATVGRLLG
jgi:hypothetical protein